MEQQYIQKAYSLELENNQVLHKITADDPVLLYVVCLAGIDLALARLNRTIKFSVGIPALDGTGMHQMENEITQIPFKSFLQTIRVNISELMHKDENDSDSVVNHIVSFEGINTNPAEHYDAWFHIENKAGGIIISITCNPERYNLATMDLLMKSVCYVMKECLNNLNINIDELLNVNEEENEMIYSFNHPKECFDAKQLRSIPAVFLDVAEKYKDRPALVENGRIMTYQELDETSNQLANYLKNKGVVKGDTVAILNGRTMETIISMVAILKLGAAYAPIDANYPREKIDRFLENTFFSQVLTLKCHLPLVKEELMSKVSILDQEEPEIKKCAKEFEYVEDMQALCYVIFTSGSTGESKVAAVKHIGWSNLLQWFTDRYKVTEEDRVYLISSISFDISQRSIFMALSKGAALHLYADSIYDPAKIRNYIEENVITLLNCAPSTFYPLIEECEDHKELEMLRCLFLGGEAISAQRLVQWYNSEDCHAIISNVYGVAECTDVSSFYELCNFEKYLSESVPIGYPIYNSELFIVDEDGGYLPPGSVGEICIAGIGLGAGYINDSELTKKKFVQLKDGLQVYLTGDIGRFNGEYIEYAGRKDYQVKIRGNRVELGDIENAIRQNKYIKEAVVIKDINEQVVAFVEKVKDEVIPMQDTELVSAVYEEIRRKLPTYMIPDRITIIEKIPVNNNGKIDRLALSKIEVQVNEEIDESVTGLERDIMLLVMEVLNKSSINISENIFNQGMHSILVVKLVALLNEKYGTKLAPIDIYVNSTIKKLADKLSSLGKE